MPMAAAQADEANKGRKAWVSQWPRGGSCRSLRFEPNRPNRWNV